jgi:hypothetical protein
MGETKGIFREYESDRWNRKRWEFWDMCFSGNAGCFFKFCV